MVARGQQQARLLQDASSLDALDSTCCRDSALSQLSLARVALGVKDGLGCGPIVIEFFPVDITGSEL